MSDDELPKGIQGALVQRLRDIPDGQITAAARRAGLALTQLLRLRRGENTDVRLSTLEKLADGLGVPASSLIGEPGQKIQLPPPPARGVDPRTVRRLIKRTRAYVDDVERFVSGLPDEEEAAPVRRDRAPRASGGKR